MKNDFSKLLSGFLASSAAGGQQGEIVSRSVSIDDENFIYQAYLPPQAGAGEKLPLIVFLHGIRERGTGGFISGMFAQIAKQYLKLIPAIVLLPQCRPNRFWADAQMDEMVMRQIKDVSREYSVDEKRKYLIGISMGGYGAWHFAATYPDDFAAIVSICGGSPLTSENRFAEIAEKIGKTPAWLFHGSADPVVQVSESRNMVAAINERGGRVKYSEYEGVGHNVWLNALGETELLPWLLSQKKD
jgi:predicted peptidase